jgi:hypothetical protein
LRATEESLKQALDVILKEASERGEETAAVLSQLQRDMVSIKVHLCEGRGLDTAQCDNLTRSLQASIQLQLDDIAASLARIEQEQREAGRGIGRLELQQDRIIDLIQQALSLTASQQAEKTRMLDSLTISFDLLSIPATVQSIGMGSFGVVLRAEYRCHAVAVKKVPCVEGSAAAQQLENEILLLDHLKDPSIIQCFGFCRDMDFLYIVLELAEHGSLWDVLQRQASNPVALEVSWLMDVADALSHMHHKRVVHKDIKAENALVIANYKIKVHYHHHLITSYMYI